MSSAAAGRARPVASPQAARNAGSSLDLLQWVFRSHLRTYPRSPPPTGTVTPVMYEASSDARNRMGPACSSSVP